MIPPSEQQHIPALFINLDRNTERLAWQTRQAAAIGIAPERVAAVDGRLFSPAELEERLGPGSIGAEQAGELGCHLSHRKAWQRAVDIGAPWTAIFEDDIHLSADTAAFLRQSGWIPGDADIVKLETFCHSADLSVGWRSVQGGRRLHRLAGFHVGAAGYLISRKAALHLLGFDVRLRRPVDAVLFGTRRAPAAALTLYQLVPALCVQEVRLAHQQRRQSADVSNIPREWGKPRTLAERVRREFVRHRRLLGSLARLYNPRAKVPFR